MGKALHYPQVFGRLLIVFTVLAVLFTAFLLLSNRANAADAGEFVHFRIDSELDVLIADKGTLTIRWYCTGATTFGEINDGTASESTNSADGIIKVASASTEMTDSSCTIGSSETLRASASIDGWVAREWTAASFPGASTSSPFATGASLDYTILVNGVDDELGTAITLDGVTASATYSGTVASQSYSGGKRYIAGSTSGGTVTAGADGYVNRTSSAMTVSGTASQSIDFGVGTDSDLDESGLDFGHKIRVYESGGDFTNNKFTTGTVTAGDSFGTTCTNNADGNWYCAVPLANTETSAKFVLSGYVTTTATYADRSIGSAASNSADITPVTVTPGGGGGSTPSPTPTPAPSPTPTPVVSVTPTPGVSVTPTPVPGSAVKLYRKVSDPKVYVMGVDGMLTWVRTLEEFNAAGYKWSDVQLISGPEFAKFKMASVSAAKLIRQENNPRVYAKGSDGGFRWVKTLQEFNANGYKWEEVQLVSGAELAGYQIIGRIKVVSGIAFLRVRENPSTNTKVLGQVLPGQEIDFSNFENGWYKIKKDGKDWGWVFGGYAKEI